MYIPIEWSFHVPGNINQVLSLETGPLVKLVKRIMVIVWAEGKKKWGTSKQECAGPFSPPFSQKKTHAEGVASRLRQICLSITMISWNQHWATTLSHWTPGIYTTRIYIHESFNYSAQTWKNGNILLFLYPYLNVQPFPILIDIRHGGQWFT